MKQEPIWIEKSYQQTDIFSLAACYAHGLSDNHSFVDGLWT